MIVPVSDPEHTCMQTVHAVNQLAKAASGLVQLVFDGAAGRKGFELHHIIMSIAYGCTT
jgi:hypothetical protein